MRLHVLLAVLVAFAASASAQISKGNLTGIVTDPSGSAVPLATVRLVNTGTGAQRTEQSDSFGIYRFMTLDAGSYRVDVEATGFKKFIREGIELRVGETTTLNLQLEIGQSAESVTVTGESPLLRTESASLGNTVSGLTVQELPTLTRNAYNLVQLSPGIQYRSDGSLGLAVYSNDGTSQFGSSGTKGMASFLMDGVPNMRVQSDGQVGGSVGFTPSPDAVQQLDVHTNAFDAEYGHTGGGAVSVTTKSGTNQMHSTIYWYLQNKDLNANPFFNNLSGLPRVQATQNWYGASVGGPVYVPKVYNGMNKTHFFFDFEGTNVRGITLGNFLVPTALQLQGNFSQTTNSKGAAVTIYDPATTVPSGSGYVRSPFPGNIIPAPRFDPVAVNMLKYYPAPNRTPTSALIDNFQNLYSTLGGGITRFASLVGRVDHQLASKHQLFFRWGWNKRFDDDTSEYGPCCVVMSPNNDFYRGNIMAGVGDTWLVNSRTVVDFRFGFYRYFDAAVLYAAGTDMTTLGYPAIFANSADYKWFPRITMADGDVINFGLSGNPDVNYQTSFSPLVNAHTNIGRHALKYGFSWEAAQDNAVQPALTTGGLGPTAMGFEFDHTFTQGPNPTVTSSVAGNDFASFLLGDVTAGSYP